MVNEIEAKDILKQPVRDLRLLNVLLQKLKMQVYCIENLMKNVAL